MSQSIVDDIDTSLASNAKIKVIGVGGGGGNAVQNMIAPGLVRRAVCLRQYGRAGSGQKRRIR